MGSLVYLVAMGVKNTLWELVHKPAKLVLYLLIVVAIFGALAASLFSPSQIAGAAPVFWLDGIVFAILVLLGAYSVQKGLTSGDVIFDMNDVNLLFVSPVNPRTILLYGLVKLAKVSFFAGFFILFQSSTLRIFGVDFGGLLVLFVEFIFCVIVLSLLSLVIYSVSNGRPRRKTAVRALAVACLVPFAAHLLFLLASTGDPVSALEQGVQSPFMAATPIVGWIAGSYAAFLSGDVAGGLAGVGLCAAAFVLMVVFIMRSRVDYYEDVLVATESAFERKRALEEGNVQSAPARAKVKVTKTGIGGRGASAFFYKQLRETFRQNRFGFLSVWTVVVFVCILAGSVLFRDELDLVTILQVVMWIQVFLIGTGSGIKELYSHYIFLVPEPPFKKVVWGNMLTVFRSFLEGVLYLGVPGIVLGVNPVVTLEAVCVYTLFSFLLIGLNYLSVRVTGASVSQGMLLAIYVFAVMLAMLPGIVAALVLGFAVAGDLGLMVGLAALCLWELLAGSAFFALARNVLHNCDMPNAKLG